VRRRAGACLLLAVALASLTALSGGLPASAATSPATVTAAPWETAGPFPTSFDLSALGRVTPVRSQDNFSTCWIMAATGSLESAAVTAEGRTPDGIDFSENNLANHMASRLDYEGMAPSELAAAYYARWEGPVWEASDPYPRPDRSPPYVRAVRHVQEVLFLPQRRGPLDNDAVKWAVLTYGGVDAAAYFHTQADAGHWNASTSAYYSDTPGDLNHHILCVGWDDTYPADNFLAGRRPPGDGAFLIKNSWGDDWGGWGGKMKGYCWVSYYDANFGRALAVFDGVETAANYDAVYQYDALGRSAWVTVDGSEQAWYASRFTSAGTGEVTAAAFYTPVPGTAYEVRVARTLGGIAAAPAAAAGTVEVGGYHTVGLGQPAAVVAGDPFVVAVRVTTPGWTEPVPVEAPSALIAPRARKGQSFVSADGSAWTDLTAVATLPGAARANVCLKAFVDAAGAGDTRPPHVELRGGTIRRGARATIRWRLEDPAFSSGSAILELSVRSASGRVVAHRRIPAVVVGERGVWSFTAYWPQGRYSVRGRAYDVAGGRQETATRATVLVRGVAPGLVTRLSGQKYRR
jgi:C1A family cysteine protease